MLGRGLIIGSMFLTTPALGATINVGPSDDYSKIEAAGPGDEVVIAPGKYAFRVYLTGQGTQAQPIKIRAADPNNRPEFEITSLVEDAPGSYTGGDNGRGCWQIAGSYYEISGLDIHGCHTASGNSAGIRTIAADHVTVKDVYLHDNQAGFTGDGENISVEFSELAKNGQPGSPPQHNVYIYGGSFALRHSYVHDSVGGQNLHIRARESVIEANWIARAANYEVDMMPGNDPDHSMLFRGNLLLGNTNPENGGQVIALYNDAGTGGITMKLKAVWNTFVIQSGKNPALVNVLNDALQSADVELSNNIFVGTNSVYAVQNSGTGNANVAGTKNFLATGADAGVLGASVFGSDPGFGTDYRLAASSLAIGMADGSVTEPPDREYFENEVNARKFRWRATHADLGAFESTTSGNGYGPYDDPGAPPPTGGSGGGSGSGGSVSGGSGGSGTGASSATGGASTGGKGGSGSGGKNQASGSGDDGGCGCRVRRADAPRGISWFSWALLLTFARKSRRLVSETLRRM